MIDPMFMSDEYKIMGATDLRAEMPKLIKDLKTKKILVMKRGRPVAVIESYQDFMEKESFFDKLEEQELVKVVKERMKNHRDGKGIALEELVLLKR